MAVDDVVSDIQDIAAAGNLDFQPAAGVEVMITEIVGEVWAGAAPDSAPNIDVLLIDGTLNDAFVRTGGSTGGQMWSKPLRLVINNTRYLRLVNKDGATRNIGYCGIQTK